MEARKCSGLLTGHKFVRTIVMLKLERNCSMKSKFVLAAALAAIAGLSACAQQEEPAEPVVIAEPVYDKYGNVVE
jgi:hypothetical protein